MMPYVLLSDNFGKQCLQSDIVCGGACSANERHINKAGSATALQWLETNQRFVPLVKNINSCSPDFGVSPDVHAEFRVSLSPSLSPSLSAINSLAATVGEFNYSRQVSSHLRQNALSTKAGTNILRKVKHDQTASYRRSCQFSINSKCMLAQINRY